MEKVQYWHVLHVLLEMFLARYCNVYLFQYKLKEIYIAWKNILKSRQRQQTWAVSAVISVLIFRQGTSTVSSLTQVPWPLHTGSPTNTGCFCLLLTTSLHSFFSAQTPSFLSLLRNLCFCFHFYPDKLVLLHPLFTAQCFSHIYRHKRTHVHCHLLSTFRTNLLKRHFPLPLAPLHKKSTKNSSFANSNSKTLLLTGVLCISLALPPVPVIT